MRETSNDHRERCLARRPRPQKAGSLGLEQLIAERIRQLPAFERKVLALRCKEGLRLPEIAKAFGVGQSRVFHAYTQAVQTIQPLLETEV